MSAPLPWKGRADEGGREFSPLEAAKVEAFVAGRRGYPLRTTLREIEAATQIQGRTIRAWLSALDGEKFVLAYDGDALWCAEHAEEAERYSWRLRAIIRTMTERLDRRERFAARLAAQQPGLFGR
jgi:hypothetical protein